MAACRFHHDRPGIGVCMRCRAVICSECCTRVDGVNHCHACLRDLGGRTRPKRSGGRVIGGIVVLLVCWLLSAAFFWRIQGWLAP